MVNMIVMVPALNSLVWNIHKRKQNFQSSGINVLIEIEEEGRIKQSRKPLVPGNSRERLPRENDAILSQRKRGGNAVPGRENSTEKWTKI